MKIDRHEMGRQFVSRKFVMRHLHDSVKTVTKHVSTRTFFLDETTVNSKYSEKYSN